MAELLDQSEEDMDTEDIVVVLDGAGADNPNVSMSDEPLAFVPHGPQPTQDDSEEGAESDEEDVTDDEDDDIIDEDRYNSAGEEVSASLFEVWIAMMILLIWILFIIELLEVNKPSPSPQATLNHYHDKSLGIMGTSHLSITMRCPFH